MTTHFAVRMCGIPTQRCRTIAPRFPYGPVRSREANRVGRLASFSRHGFLTVATGVFGTNALKRVPDRKGSRRLTPGKFNSPLQPKRHVGARLRKSGLDREVQSANQSSRTKPGTRPNSLTLFVTSGRHRAIACPAMRTSNGPIGIPCLPR